MSFIRGCGETKAQSNMMSLQIVPPASATMSPSAVCCLLVSSRHRGTIAPLSPPPPRVPAGRQGGRGGSAYVGPSVHSRGHMGGMWPSTAHVAPLNEGIIRHGGCDRRAWP